MTDNSLTPNHMYPSIIESEIISWHKYIFLERHSPIRSS